MVFVKPNIFIGNLGPEDEEGSDYQYTSDGENSSTSDVSHDLSISNDSDSDPDNSDVEMVSDHDPDYKSPKSLEAYDELQAEKYLSILAGLWPRRIFRPSLIGADSLHFQDHESEEFKKRPGVLARETGRPFHEKSIRELLGWIRWHFTGNEPSAEIDTDVTFSENLKVPAKFPKVISLRTYQTYAEKLEKTMSSVLRNTVFPIIPANLTAILAELSEDAQTTTSDEAEFKLRPPIARVAVDRYLKPMEDGEKDEIEIKNRWKRCRACSKQIKDTIIVACDICRKKYHTHCAPKAQDYLALTGLYTCPECRPSPENGPTCRLPGCFNPPADSKLYCCSGHGQKFLKMVFSHVQAADPHKLAWEVSKLVDETGVNIPRLESSTTGPQNNVQNQSSARIAQEISQLQNRLAYWNSVKLFIVKATERRSRLILGNEPTAISRPTFISEIARGNEFVDSFRKPDKKPEDWRFGRDLFKAPPPAKPINPNNPFDESEGSFEYTDDSDWRETYEQTALRVVLGMHPSDEEYTAEPIKAEHIAEDIFGSLNYYSRQADGLELVEKPSDAGETPSSMSMNGDSESTEVSDNGLLSAPAPKKRRVTTPAKLPQSKSKRINKKPVSITGKLIRKRIAMKKLKRKKELKEHKERKEDEESSAYSTDSDSSEEMSEPFSQPDVCGMDTLLLQDFCSKISELAARSEPLEDGPTVCHKATVLCVAHANWPQQWNQLADAELRETAAELERLAQAN